MRLCMVLLQQHAGEMFVKHWKIQRKRILVDSGALRELKKTSIKVIDAAEYIFPQTPKTPEPTPASRLEPREMQQDECLLFKDSNALIGGLNQAQVLTNTVESNIEQLPQFHDGADCKLPDNCDDHVVRCLTNSLIYEVEQKKLPKRKDPERPAWNFPRDYGITDRRKNKLLCLRLLDLCSKFSHHLPVIEDGVFTIALERQNLPVTLSLRSDALVLTNKQVQVEASVPLDLTLPDITPLLPTISIETAPAIPDQHPLTVGSNYGNIQLAVSHFNGTEVVNLYETEVTEDQFLGRSLMKAFTFAASQAKYLYGIDVVNLPTPLFVPCLHTDSHRFHFSIFQLNTLAEQGKVRNVHWTFPLMHLYSECEYSSAKPLVKDYNPDVFKTLFKLYSM